MAEGNVKLTLPDGAKIEVPRGTTVHEAISTIGAGLARAAVAARLDGDYLPLSESVQQDAKLEVVTRNSEDGLDVLRHSTAHLMAYAVQELFPNARFGFGPPVENGFYYDIQVDEPFSEDDLARIEKRMVELAKQGFEIERTQLSHDEALQRFGDQPFKVDQIQELGSADLYAYQMGEFTDLCEGPHVPNTKEIKAFKLQSVAGAYWRGDENNEQLQRIYGTSFYSKKDLQTHLQMLEEAKARDHRKLGKELDLFSIQDDAGGGLAFYHPKGSVLRHLLMDFWNQEHQRNGYQLVDTPHISRGHLWHTSGHMDFYKDDMYVFEVEGQEFVVKPMNCPGHILIYKRRLWSYRELPVRYAEMGTVYRNERSGTLHGMLRVRGFTQDDAHIFCTPDQLEDEILGVLKLTRHILTTFGFDDMQVELSVRDPQKKEKYAGSDEEWEKAEQSLVRAIEAEGLEFRRMEGEAVFYGPKIDVKLVDALGRKWQASTCQFDFNLPRRFGVEYVDDHGDRKNVFMVHRAIFGSLERFIGMLTEHYAGNFPLWLAPVQVSILPVGDDFVGYAHELDKRLLSAGIRSQVDARNEKIGRKIRDAEMEKVPYMAVVGAREQESGEVAVRRHGHGDQGTQAFEAFLGALLDEIARKD